MTLVHRDDRPALARMLGAFELLQHRLMALHAPEFTTLDLTMAQAKLLYVLMASGELSLSQTAQQLGVAMSTASGAVEHLVALGLVGRAEDPHNRRQIRVSISAAGCEMLEHMREFSTRQFVELAAHLDDDELAVIERATGLLARAAQAAAPHASAPPPAPPAAPAAPRPTPATIGDAVAIDPTIDLEPGSAT